MRLIKSLAIVVFLIQSACCISFSQTPLVKKFLISRDLKTLKVLGDVKFKGKVIASTGTQSNVPAANRTVRNGRTTDVVPFDGSSAGATEKPGNPTSAESNGALCQSIPVTLTAGFSELNVLDPNSVEIWAGRLIRISSIDDGAYSDFRENNVPLTRKPLTIALVAAGTSERTVRTTIQPTSISQGGIIDAMNSRKRDFGRNDFGSDTWLYEMYDYTNMDQFSMEAGLGISAVPINLDIRASAGFSTSTKKNKIIIKFFRKAFDVRIDTDINELVTATEISNDAGVIASVGYGSWGIVEIESDSSLSDIKAALDASFQVDPSVSVTANLNTQMKNTVASFSIKAIFKGVSGNQSVRDVRSVDDLRRVLSDNVEQYSATTPVVPVSFTVKSLSNGETMMLRSTMTYTKRDCTPIPDKPKNMNIRVKMLAFTCPQVSDGLTDDEDIYGVITVDATNAAGVTNKDKNVWNKGINSLVRVKKSQKPEEAGAYSLNGVASDYTFVMPTDQQSLASGQLWITLDINDEEWGKPVPYEKRILKLQFKDVFQSIKSTNFQHDNIAVTSNGTRAFFVETVEIGRSNKMRLWLKIIED